MAEQSTGSNTQPDQATHAARHVDGDDIWDTHFHVFGPWDRYPLPPNPSYRPDEAPFDATRALHARMGVTRGVIVHGANYGADHSALLGALTASQGAYRGIAVIDPEIPEATLRIMHDAGVRGIRFNVLAHLGGGAAHIDAGRMRAAIARVAVLGWHVLVHAGPDDTIAVLEALDGCGVPMVVDHMARLPADGGLRTRAGQALLRWLGSTDVWIKVSGADRVTQGQPEQAIEQMRALIAAAPDRVLWGSDFPHVNIKYAAPNDVALLDLARRACGDAATARALLTDNPARLYA
ncbi:Amidohydrolase-related domain-containing protein [Bordetella sputigena]|uniref:amidohydrolase family protein n=1 Tax=Bordetella sputigena TaxID=1416810 RepID=UPI0039EED2B2